MLASAALAVTLPAATAPGKGAPVAKKDPPSAKQAEAPHEMRPSLALAQGPIF